MSVKKILLVLLLVLVYFGINYAFLSSEEYTSMEDYINSTKNEFKSIELKRCYVWSSSTMVRSRK